jgi:5-methylcytosine-specific restriction endonuclease McrA
MNTRTCTHCQKLKELERGFYFIKRSQSYETRCKRCVAAYQRDRNKKDGGASTRKCYQKRKAEGKIISVPYGERTKEQKQAAIDAVKRWRAKNRERCNMENRAGLQMRRSLPYQRAWPLIVHHYGGKCLSCGSGKVVFDHVIPLSTGGTNELHNGQPLCVPCNTFKGATIRDKDHRPDQGAWIRELIALNPWLMVIGSGHKQGWHKTVDGKAYWERMHEMASGEMKMPESREGLGSTTKQSDDPVSDFTTLPTLADDLASIIGLLHEKAPTSLCSDRL